MKLTVDLAMDTAAFDDDLGEEAARILEVVAHKLRDGYQDGRLRDVNGNTVGCWQIEREGN